MTLAELVAVIRQAQRSCHAPGGRSSGYLDVKHRPVHGSVWIASRDSLGGLYQQ